MWDLTELVFDRCLSFNCVKSSVKERYVTFKYVCLSFKQITELRIPWNHHRPRNYPWF